MSVGDTIHLTWTFANDRLLEITAADFPRFLGGLRIPNVDNTIDNQSLILLGLSGDPVNNPSFKGETSVGTLNAFFQEPETGLDIGEIIRFSGLEIQFDVTALASDPNVYEQTRLVIRSGVDAGSFAVVPEPSRVLLSLVGIAAIGLRRRRS